MAFRFNMQKVLDYREQLEEEAKVRLAQAKERHRDALQRLENLELALNEAEAKARDNQLMDAAERWLHEGYVKGLRSDVKSASMQAQITAGIVEECRKLLTARAIDKKILDKLKARKKHQHMRDELMKEQHTNDETATLRYKAPAL